MSKQIGDIQKKIMTYFSSGAEFVTFQKLAEHFSEIERTQLYNSVAGLFAAGKLIKKVQGSLNYYKLPDEDNSASSPSDKNKSTKSLILESVGDGFKTLRQICKETFLDGETVTEEIDRLLINRELKKVPCGIALAYCLFEKKVAGRLYNAGDECRNDPGSVPADEVIIQEREVEAEEERKETAEQKAEKDPRSHIYKTTVGDVDLDKFKQMVREGKSHREMAEAFGFDKPKTFSNLIQNHKKLKAVYKANKPANKQKYSKIQNVLDDLENLTKMLADGKSQYEVADYFGVSVNTFIKYKKQKIEINNTYEEGNKLCKQSKLNDQAQTHNDRRKDFSTTKSSSFSVVENIAAENISEEKHLSDEIFENVEIEPRFKETVEHLVSNGQSAESFREKIIGIENKAASFRVQLNKDDKNILELPFDYKAEVNNEPPILDIGPEQNQNQNISRTPSKKMIELSSGNLFLGTDGNIFDMSKKDRELINKIIDLTQEFQNE